MSVCKKCNYEGQYLHATTWKMIPCDSCSVFDEKVNELIDEVQDTKFYKRDQAMDDRKIQEAWNEKNKTKRDE